VSTKLETLIRIRQRATPNEATDHLRQYGMHFYAPPDRGEQD